MPAQDKIERTAQDDRPVSGPSKASNPPAPNSQARVGVTKYADAGLPEVS
jgi:hypothetical protein